MQTEHLLATAPVFLLAIDDGQRIVHRSAAARIIVPDEKRHLREAMDAASAKAFAGFQRSLSPDDAPAHLLATFIDARGRPRKIAGLIDRAACPDGSILLRFTASHAGIGGNRDNWLENLMLSEEVLHGFAQTSSEATWCIEFSEPVDIGQSDSEIVRQVFENDCHWLFCNEALTQLYQLPEGLDIARQPVSLYFPRIPENEAFVLQIIKSGFAVDNAPSTDYRHDGSVRYMENNVRCSIADGYLFRIFGTLRDVTRIRQTHKRLKNEVEKMRGIFAALPDAIMVIDRDRRLVAVNASFETLFGWNGEDFLGRDVQSIIDLEQSLPGKQCWYGHCRQCWRTMVRTESNTFLHCEARIAPLGEETPGHFVLSLRPATDDAASARNGS
ncbi:MAG: PAS domain-containing protein [Azoarcus sp.]|jgi:PAS domain S-box-containing protein|nr:PAS domain-containing protein [Azoarcus sp.]